MTRKVYILALSLLTLIGSSADLRAETQLRKWVLNLYGHVVQFDFNADFYKGREKLFTETSLNEFIHGAWNSKETDSLINQLDHHAQQLRMDDMAYLMMLDKFTDLAFKNTDDRTKTAFKYSILSKKGFDVMLGYSATSLTLYGRLNVKVDNCFYITKNSKQYFDLSFSQKKEDIAEKELLTYYPLSHRTYPIVMNTIAPPDFHAKKQRKIFPFEYDGFVYFISCDVNTSLVEYYRDLPPIDINTVYLNYGMSEGARKSLVKQLREITSDMTTTAAVDFLLRFTQSSFEYKKDEVVYGQEKFSFPEETLVNSFSDCEDKAMLFAYLVKEVTGLKTVALFYKDAEHINVALENWRKDQKSTFTFQNQDYIVCEPTSVGFSIGESSTFSTANLIDW